MDGIYYEDFAEKYQIAKYIVQMDTAYGAGTGFLYTRKGSSCIYIITVCHVVLKSIVKKERICIRYQNHEKGHDKPFILFFCGGNQIHNESSGRGNRISD